jgi:hypothetical protein
MATAQTAVTKISSDIEYRVIGNAFGLLIASAGLVGGTMVNQRSFDYWFDDLVPIIFALYMAFRLFRNFLSTLMLYQDAPPRRRTPAKRVQAEQAAFAQLPPVPGYTPEQVMDEVARRIEAQREASAKKNKFTN